MPDREASAFALRYFGEMSNAQVAEALGVTADAAAMAVFKARARLKVLLGLDEG